MFNYQHITNTECRYAITMISILLINILLCVFTLVLFKDSAPILISNILFLLSSINLVANVNNNKYLSSLFYILNILQLFISWRAPSVERFGSDNRFFIQRIVTVLFICILNFCNVQYNKYNKILKDQEKIVESILNIYDIEQVNEEEEDDDDEDEDEEEKELKEKNDTYVNVIV